MDIGLARSWRAAISQVSFLPAVELISVYCSWCTRSIPLWLVFLCTELRWLRNGRPFLSMKTTTKHEFVRYFLANKNISKEYWKLLNNTMVKGTTRRRQLPTRSNIFVTSTVKNRFSYSMNRLNRVPPLISEVGGNKFFHLGALCNVFLLLLYIKEFFNKFSQIFKISQKFSVDNVI